jgi:hypothetical protein
MDEPTGSSLSWSEFHAIYTGLAGVMFVAGLGLLANWIAAPDVVVLKGKKSQAAQVVAVGEHLPLSSPLFIVGIVLLAAAFYVFIAALTDTKGLRLPRKGAVVKGERDQRMREATQSLAAAALAYAYSLGTQFQLYDGLTLPTALEWRTQLGKFVGETWGHHYGTPIFSGEGSKRTRRDERESAIYDVLQPTLARLSAFIFTVHSVPLQRDASFGVVRGYHEWFGNKAAEVGQLVANQIMLLQQSAVPEDAP